MSATKTLQVSCVQLHWAKSLERNLERTLHYIRLAAGEGSRVVLFPETNLTSYYFPYVARLKPAAVERALEKTCHAAKEAGIWVIVGSLRKTTDRFLNLAHVISPSGDVTHEYAKVHMAGRDERKFCRGGNKLSLFDIDGVRCTLVICRDGRHPELYRLPAMAGAQVLFHPSCKFGRDRGGVVETCGRPRPTTGWPEQQDVSLRSQYGGPVTRRPANLQRPIVHPRAVRHAVG